MGGGVAACFLALRACFLLCTDVEGVLGALGVLLDDEDEEGSSVRESEGKREGVSLVRNPITPNPTGLGFNGGG